MGSRLSGETIKQRFLEWRNIKRLYREQKERNGRLVEENKVLQLQVVQLQKVVETQAIQIAELREKIFGKKRDTDPPARQKAPHLPQQQKQPRDSSSYQRPVPPEPPTATETLTVACCKHCKGRLTQSEEVVRYIEDIILPQLLGKMTKTITKVIIQRGYCTSCGVWSSAKDLRGALVTLGQNIKLLVCYLVTILDCSYEQVKTLTGDLYGITISDGEITNILQEQSILWLPEYERILAVIRAGPGGHLDETPWPIQIFAKHCFAWVLSAVGGGLRIYKLAASRGKDHAEELLGEAGELFVRITDCYAAYKNMPGLQQICWVHLYRKIRDLVENENLPTEKLPYVREWYEEFCGVYADLRTYLAEPFAPEKRAAQTVMLRQKIIAVRQPDSRDPKKLRNLKLLLTEYDSALFTCMQFPNIPCDNNRAEQDIRLLVQKRKKCFGSRTEAGARALEILLSVTWSTWHTNRANFLPALAVLNTQRNY